MYSNILLCESFFGNLMQLGAVAFDVVWPISHDVGDGENTLHYSWKS